MRTLQSKLVLLFLALALGVLASGCAHPDRMYQDFESSNPKTYPDAKSAFAASHPVPYEVGKKTTLEFASTDPVLMLDPDSHNIGYFKVASFTLKDADTYHIKGILNCRCFGKMSGKNAVVPRLYVMEMATHKIVMAQPGLVKEHLNFMDGDQYINEISGPMKPGDYEVLVAVDNTLKGGLIFTGHATAYAPTMMIPLSIPIYSAPDGYTDLEIKGTKVPPKKEEPTGVSP